MYSWFKDLKLNKSLAAVLFVQIKEMYPSWNLKNNQDKRKRWYSNQCWEPNISNEYRRCKWYVDHRDMWKSYYAIDRKSKTSEHMLFRYFQDIFIVNSFVINLRELVIKLSNRIGTCHTAKGPTVTWNCFDQH